MQTCLQHKIVSTSSLPYEHNQDGTCLVVIAAVYVHLRLWTGETIHMFIFTGLGVATFFFSSIFFHVIKLIAISELRTQDRE